MDINESLQWPSGCDLSFSQLSQEPSNYQMTQQYTPDSSALYNYTAQRLPYRSSYNMTYSPTSTESSCPRTYTGLDLVGSVGSMNEAYPPSAYLLEPQKSQDMLDVSSHFAPGSMCQFKDDFEGQCLPVMKSADSNYGHSRFDSDIGMPNSIPTPEPQVTPIDICKSETPHEDANVDKEQPYAQLIYRALMEQEGHTMVLRDIYNWFKRNTDKATDKETKGWQNSIRHNLSMNGAFEKVDQPVGDAITREEAKKGFMWRLTDSAIREGVKSTTRYRSKLPNKRGCRSQNPAPQRQASGAKGGQAARKAARLRRSERLRDTRSVPMHKGDTYPSRPGPSYTPFDNFTPSDLATGYPASPYYCHSEMDFGTPIKQEALPSSFGQNLDILSGQTYPDSPQGLCSDMHYLLPYSPEEPLFYGSGSESGSEPMTPPSQDYCAMDTSMPQEPACYTEAGEIY
ncbi:uncharacterized protein BDZ99DRAFT_381656 [Mytilinidion resinicola]|uniref:Fork-head domain-containing protein n=1 Tax=Mytilinidion resinicola TaxID=574789 RepID=A0A6A6YWJ5_9PEZI|nr:uncharacterized protein BDZ99DRAFT_381656 [Mytilinidion resinicola]KAF2812889.1 hypothetical protein BDZ99DRAFT_381656 [Mytilinidion resinicola]